MLEGKGYSRKCYKHRRYNVVDIIETTVVRVTTKCEVTILSHHKMYRATQRKTASEGAGVEGCSLRYIMWEDEVEPSGFVTPTPWTDALVWETVEEHTFTLVAEAPGSLRVWCLRYIVREDVEVGRGGLMNTTCCTDTLVWETIEENHFTILAEAPGSLCSRYLLYIMWEDEVEPSSLVGTACCTDTLVWETVEEHRFT